MNDFKSKLKAFGLQILVAILAMAGSYLGSIEIGKGNSPATPTTPATPTQPVPPPAQVARPSEAIGKIQIGTFGCSATVMMPRLPSGEYDVSSAAHCVPQGFKNGIMRLDNGKQFGIVLLAIDRESDCAWFRTVGDVGELPACHLADSLPAVGDPVWHQGYGEHQPRNREDGIVVAPSTGKGQSQYRISVSSGDSGGGIICDKTGKLLSTVCCTTHRNVKGDVWGCNVESLKRLRPKTNVNALEWSPIDIPYHSE